MTDLAKIIDLARLVNSAGAARVEGEAHGVDVSLIVVEGRTGSGPELHEHPYPEVFVVVDGTVRFYVGDEESVVTGGTVVIGPANVPHRFQVEGDGPARLVNIHSSARFQTTWL